MTDALEVFSDKMRVAAMELGEIGRDYGMAGFGGFLRCEECGREEPLGDANARVDGGGWPKCHGLTMRWWTQRQIDRGEVPDLAP